MPTPFASVLIPTRNPGPPIERVLQAVLAQQTDFPFEVVIVDSASRAEDVAVMRSFDVRFFHIEPSQFGHGRTRNLLASLAHGERLLFLSQDAEPVDTTWLRSLLEPFADQQVAGCYARQVPRPGADPLIRFFLATTYDARPARRRLDGRTAVRIDDIFFSNVSSAIRRDVWQQVPFRDQVVMSEDQYWAYDALHAGYEVVYYPTARVYHSHNYSLRALFQRNWQSGASLRGLIADSPPAIARRGAAYVLGQTQYLLRTRRAHWLPYMLLYEATKATAFSLGTRFGRQHA